jgi:hypothetical protein
MIPCVSPLVRPTQWKPLEDRLTGPSQSLTKEIHWPNISRERSKRRYTRWQSTSVVEFETANRRTRTPFECDQHTRVPQLHSYHYAHPYSSIPRCDIKNKESAAPPPFNADEEFTVITFSDSGGGTIVAPVREWDQGKRNRDVEKRGKKRNLDRCPETTGSITGMIGRTEVLIGTSVERR